MSRSQVTEVQRSLPPPPSGRDGWPWTRSGDVLPATLPDGRPWPRISVVTPSYNQANFLEATLRSVLLQGYPDLELIVIDGGSDDDSVSILERYEPWLTYWSSEADDGQTYAIAKGMEWATGAIVNWLNSDDMLWPGALQAVARAWARVSNPMCVLCGDAVVIDASGTVVSESRVRPWEDPLLPVSPPYVGGEQASWYLTREAWNAAGGIDLDLDFTMDSDLICRAVQAGAAFEPVGAVVAAYREHDATKTRREWRQSMAYKESFRYRWLAKASPEERPHFARRVRRDLFGLYLQHVRPADGLARRLEKVARAVRTYPQALLKPYHVRRMASLLWKGEFETK